MHIKTSVLTDPNFFAMRIKTNAFRDPNFRGFIIPYAVYSLGKWISLSALPSLIAQKFNSQATLVVSLGLHVLPQVICAPLIATTLLKKGPKTLLVTAILWLAVTQLTLPHIANHFAFQGLILFTGIIDTAIVASVSALRSQLIPEGENISANALFATVERSSRILGPALAVVILWKLSITQSFYATALLLIIASTMLSRANIRLTTKPSNTLQKVEYSSFLRLFRSKPILWTIFIPGLGYAILLGTLNLFLFWSNTETFHNLESRWTLLLTAHGIGAMLGSIIAPKALCWINKRVPLLKTYVWMSLLRSLGFMALAGVAHFGLALAILVLVGLPELLEVVCFFTLLQKHLKAGEESVFYALSLPVFYGFVFLGTMMGGIYTKNLMSLSGFWALASGLPVLLILPFLLSNKRLNKT